MSRRVLRRARARCSLCFGGLTTLPAGTAPSRWARSGIAAHGPVRGASSPGTALDGVSLAYFATRRDGAERLDAAGAPRRPAGACCLDSRIEGFADIVERAARAAARGIYPLSATTTAESRRARHLHAPPRCRR